MRFTTLITLIGLLAFATVAQAQTHTITFDTDAAGNAIAEGTSIAEQYADWGAHFVPNVVRGVSDPYGFASYGTNTDMTATATDIDPFFLGFADPADLPKGNVLQSYSGYFNTDGDPNFWIQFDKPVKNISLDVYNGWWGTVLYGMDANLNLVNLGVGDVSPTYGKAHFTLSNNATIRYLIVTGTLDYGGYDAWSGIDNITFTSVPEPGTAALWLASGLLGAALFARRRFSSR